MTETFKVEFYRDNSKSLDATDETLNFEIEEACTSEKGMAKLKLDGASIQPGDIRAGDAVIIEIASAGTVTTKVFSGEVEDVNFIREEGEPLIEVTAYDWGKLLSERKVNLSYPTVEYVSTIAKDIVSSITSTITPGANDRLITVDNVEEIKKTRTIDFIGLSMFEALQKLSDTALTDFYVDPDKDLHFFLRGSRSANKTLNENDLVNYEVRKERDIINDCIVYGADNKTEPRYGTDKEDGWCETLTYWDSEASGGGETISVSGVPTVFTDSSTFPWTHHRTIQENVAGTFYVNEWVEQIKEWETYGKQPWLGLNSDGIWARKEHEDKQMKYFKFQDPTWENIAQFNTIQLKLSLNFVRNYDTYDLDYVFVSDCSSYDDFTGTNEPIDIGYSSVSDDQKCFLFHFDKDDKWGYIYKDIDETPSIEVEFWVRPSNTDPLNTGDEIKLFYATRSTMIDDIVCLKVRKKSDGKFYWFIETHDKDNVEDNTDTGLEAPSDSWVKVKLRIYAYQKQSAYAMFWDSNNETWKETPTLDWSGVTMKRLIWGAYWFTDVETAGNPCRIDEIKLKACALTWTIEYGIYNYTYGIWYTSTFEWEPGPEYSYGTKTFNVGPYLTGATPEETLTNLKNARLKFKVISVSGPENASGTCEIYVALLRAVVNLYTSDGSPYLHNDDGDGDYVEASEDGQTDLEWKDFDLTITQAASLEEVKVYLKGRNVNGDDDATVKVYVWDVDSRVWIDAGTITWSSGETSYTLKSLDVKTYLNERDKIINTRWKLEKIGSAGIVRITYGYMYVKYIKAASLMTFDTTIKKAGTGSIKIYWAGTIGAGTISARIWLTPPTTIGCQTTDHKEGYKFLKFAALIDMGVVSDLDYWRRPEASISTFTVRLYDSSNNRIEYAASDLYPGTTFTSFPSPEKKKMKEIQISVGENAEANGEWTRLDSDFDWTSIEKVEWRITGETKTDTEGNPYMDYIALWLDWVHFAGGRWKGRYRLSDDHASVQKYGRRTEEFFDKTAFSDEDCYYQAMYIVKKYKYPVRTLENVEIDYSGMESLSPGEIVNFDLPEGSFSLRIKKITWIWDGDLLGKLDLDNEGLQPEESTCPTGEQVKNGGFETGDFTNWNHSGDIEISSYKKHSGTYSARNVGGDVGIIYQTFDQTIPTSCFTTSSTFRAWIWGQWSPSPPYSGVFTAKIYYKDGTYTTVTRETTESEDETWVEWDLKPYLEAGKEVRQVRFELDAKWMYFMYIDDISVSP